ncbi:MAG: response regulator transcription factor [Bacteroidota bacterium]
MNEVIRIIIADDHSLFLDGLKRVLSASKDFNFDIVGTATSGQEVVRMVKMNKPHIVFLDLNMPGKDGLAVLEEIRAWNKEIKVIIVTMYDKAKIVKAAIKGGCRGYVLKMYGQSELFAAVEAVLSGENYIGKGINFSSNGIPKEEDVRFDDAFIQRHKLTKRELEILKLITQALSNKQIGKALFISDQTVSVHRKNIMRKLGVSNTAGLIKMAYDNSLI